jgi:hypothetical protein
MANTTSSPFLSIVRSCGGQAQSQRFSLSTQMRGIADSA